MSIEPSEDALLVLSYWDRAKDTLRDKRMRLIDRWRYRAFLASFDTHEPGRAPYGVKQ